MPVDLIIDYRCTEEGCEAYWQTVPVGAHEELGRIYPDEQQLDCEDCAQPMSPVDDSQPVLPASQNERSHVAQLSIAHKVLEQAAAGRDPIGDSDLYDEQPVSVNVIFTLGELRNAGLRLMPNYLSPEQRHDA
jgi:hypothetical protein